MSLTNQPNPPMPSIKDLKLVKKVEILQAKEQIQEDIMTYMNPLLDNDYEFTNLNVDDLCQIVVDNFKTLDS